MDYRLGIIGRCMQHIGNVITPLEQMYFYVMDGSRV